MAGVTHSTVSRSLNDSPLVSVATKERIKAIAAAHGYSPNDFARKLVTRRSRTLGVFLLSRDEIQFRENFGVQFLEGIAEQCRRRDYDLLFFTRTADQAKEVSYLRLCRDKRVEGVVFIGLTSEDPHVDELRASDIPVCTIDFPLVGDQCSYVTSDNHGGVYLALDHLFSLGHRKIAFLAGPTSSPVATAREASYLDYFRAKNLPALSLGPGNFTRESGYELGLRLIREIPVPTAILAANDFMALGVLRACRETGVGVPRDLSVVGYDNILAGEHSDPGLTTVAQDPLRLGASAVEVLFRKLDGLTAEPPLFLTPQLVIRESTGVCRG